MERGDISIVEYTYHETAGNNHSVHKHKPRSLLYVYKKNFVLQSCIVLEREIVDMTWQIAAARSPPRITKHVWWSIMIQVRARGGAR